MAGNLVDTAENIVLDAINGVAAPLFTAPLKCRLMTVMGTDSAAGTQVTGGSYAPPTIVFGASAAGASSNSSEMQVANMPAATIVGVEIWDSAATPRRIWSLPATAQKTVNAGDTAVIPIGAISVSLD